MCHYRTLKIENYLIFTDLYSSVCVVSDKQKSNSLSELRAQGMRDLIS